MVINEEELDEQLEIEESLADTNKSRLFDALVKSDRWEVELVDDKNYSTYVLKDTKEHYSYTFSQIIGFEQVADNEFLVYERSAWSDFMLYRFRLNKNRPEVIFNESVDHFYNLSDDYLLLTYRTNNNSENIKGVYSISKNDYVPEAKWLRGSKLVELKIDDKDVILFSKTVYPDNEVLFDFDYETFKPKEICYSTSQKRSINISTCDDIERIIKEDEAYLWDKKKQEWKLKMKEQEDAARKILKKELFK